MDVLTTFENQTFYTKHDSKIVFANDRSLSLVTSIISILCLAQLFRRILKPSKSDLSYYSKIPTLPSLPPFGSIPYLLWHVKDLPNVAFSWTRKYGMIMRTKILGKELVFLNNPKHLQKLLWSLEPAHLEKPSAIYRFLSVLEGSLTALPVPEWKIHRSILTQAFTYASLLDYIQVFNRHAIKMIADLYDLQENEKETKRRNITIASSKGLYDFINTATFKTISEIVLGSDFLSPEEVEQFHEHCERCKGIMSYRLYHPWLLPNPIWKLHSKSKELDFHFSKVTEALNKVISRAKEEVTSTRLKKSILDYLVDSHLSNKEIFKEIVMQYAAGHDTITSTMNFVLFHLAIHPDHQEKCRKEVDLVFNSREKTGAGTELTMNDLTEMKYVEQCIKESQRLFPSTPFYARELYSPIQIEPNLELKSGTICVMSPFMLHRDAQIYPDPEKYDPDRFLPENCAKRMPCTYNPFSHGPRNCIGWKFAILEMKLLTAYIVRNFELTTENTIEIIMGKLNKRMWPNDDFGVQWKKREGVTSF